MNNQEKIQKILEWQNNPYIHELTCGNNSTHKPLIPKEIDGKVVLVCRDCDYIQEYIPEMVFTAKHDYNPFENFK